MKKNRLNFVSKLSIALVLSLCSCQTVSLAEDDSAEWALSPYSHHTAPDKLYTLDDSLLDEDTRLTAASLQGLMAKGEEGLFRMTNQPSLKWLNMLESDYKMEVDRSYESDFSGLLKHFAPQLNGFILCNVHDTEAGYKEDESLSIALTLSGPLNSLVVSEGNRQLAEQAGLSLSYDARGKQLRNILNEYGSELNKRQLIYRSFERARTFLSDYAVSGNMINYYGSLSNDTAEIIFKHLEPNSVLLGWGESEDGLVRSASRESVMVHPADWANNLSVLSNIPAPTIQKNREVPLPREEDVHTVCFVMSDGDNIQWSLNDYSTDKRWYGSEFRGKLNLGWTISPALVDLAPSVMNSFYENASNSEEGRDYFIAGPSGLGYFFPDQYPHIDSSTMLLNEYMQKADLSIVNILAQSHRNQDYLDFYLSQENIDAVFLYYYSNYSGGMGNIQWVNGKPVISGRANLWEGFHSPESLAALLNKLPADSGSSEGYSLIPVHVWSMSVEDVYRCISLLDDHVQVVSPDVFVDLIASNLK